MEDNRKIIYIVSSDGRIIVPNDVDTTPLTVMYHTASGEYACEIIDSFVTMDQMLEYINGEENTVENE